MKIPRVCKTCKREFLAQKNKQHYCSKKCFKKEYYKRKRADLNNRYPVFQCKNCGVGTELSFDPLKDNVAWTSFKCPHCNPEKRILLGVIITSTRIFMTF